jgi:capsule polysaccharide export protein KpsE/RkpR
LESASLSIPDMTTVPNRDLRAIVASTSFHESKAEVDDARPQEQMTTRLRLLWNTRRFLFRVAIFGLAAFTLIAFLIPKRYESTTLLMPPDDQSGSGMMMIASLSSKLSGGLGGVAGDLLGLKSSGDLFIGMLRSRTVQDELIRKFDLKKVYGESTWQNTRRTLSTNTAISQDRKSGIITITVTDKNPQRAADMAQEYVTDLNLVVSQLTTSSAHRERVFLEERLTQVKQDLQTAEKDFSQFASKNGTIDIKEQGRAMVEGAASVEGQLIAAQSEMQGLKQIYSENNVRVRSVKARIAELQAQLQQLGGKEEIASDATNSGTQDLYPSIRKLPLLGVPYADLYRRTRVQEAVFETLSQEYELAKVAEAKETPSVKVLDPANVPEHKSFPPRLAIMFLGTFLCFGWAVVWVLGKARWQEIHPEDPQKVLVQEVLKSVASMMPWATPNGSRFQAATNRIWIRVTRHNVSSNSCESEHGDPDLSK